MSKKEKKAEGPSYEDALATYETAKKARQAAHKDVEAFEKKNGLPPMKKHGDDPTHGKGWKKLKNVWKAAKEAEAAAETAMKALKPKKERLSGKYDYPADIITSEDKKKFRTAARAAKKKAEKGEEKGADKSSKKDKKADKTAKADAPAPVEEKKSSKKDGKKKKKKAAASKED